MEEIPFGFIWLISIVFVVALVFTIGVHLTKQRRLKRLQDPRNDHYRNRG